MGAHSVWDVRRRALRRCTLASVVDDLPQQRRPQEETAAVEGLMVGHKQEETGGQSGGDEEQRKAQTPRLSICDIAIITRTSAILQKLPQPPTRRVRAIEVAKGEEQIWLASAARGVPPDYSLETCAGYTDVRGARSRSCAAARHCA
jgi:hypothetical protein